MGKKERNDNGERLKEEDLLIEVLSRLDLKTLLQCKSVSKSWHALISNPILIKSHLNRARNNVADNPTVTLIVRLDFPEEAGSFSLYQLGDGCDNYVHHLGFPYLKDDYPSTPPSLLIGCVYNIVCVCVDPCADIDANWCESTAKKLSDIYIYIYIWNPATKQSKLIPPHNTVYDCDHTVRVVFGFGFDSIEFDFKVVRVLSKDIFPEVYSLNRNVWRKIEAKLSDLPNGNIFEICLHGFLFTIGNNGMMAFDLNKEVFICDIQLPVRSNDVFIAEFYDSVAVIILSFKEKWDGIKLWTLNDEACLGGVGVKASWTMMLTIDAGERCEWVYDIFKSVEFLLVSGDWFSYNLDKKEGRYIDTNPFFDFDKVFEYTESLLPVAGSKLVNWYGKDDNEENSTDSEEVSEESSVGSEDDDERSSVGVGSEDDNEESTGGSEDDEESSRDSEYDTEEKSADSGDD